MSAAACTLEEALDAATGGRPVTVAPRTASDDAMEPEVFRLKTSGRDTAGERRVAIDLRRALIHADQPPHIADLPYEDAIRIAAECLTRARVVAEGR